MALSVKAGSEPLRTTAGSQSVTGVGFQPKAILFVCGFRTATGEHAGAYLSWGVATGASNEWAVNGSSDNGAANGQTQQTARADRICIINNTSGTTVLAVEFTSMDSDGFTINVITNTAASAYLLQYFCIGGTDITNATAGTVDLTTSGATQAVTGLGFQPDGMLFGNIGGTTWPFTGAHLIFGLGAASGNSEQAASEWFDRDGNTNMSGNSWQRSDAIALESTTANVEIMRTSLASFDSDGFTVGKDDLPGATQALGYLALKGGQFHVGVETSVTTTPATKATTGVGFQPSGLVVLGKMAVTSTTPQTHGQMCIGFADGTNNQATSIISQGSGGTSNSSTSIKSDKCALCANVDETVAGAADLASFDSDGFTLDWTTVDATSREFFYVAIGATAAPPADFLPKVLVF